MKYKHSVNDKDFSLVYFFVILEYVVLVELLVFQQFLLNVDVENTWLESMNDIINYLHMPNLFVITNYD